MGDGRSVQDLIAESLRLEFSQADMGAALQLARQALELADARGSPAERASARVAVARFRFRMAQYPAARNLAQEALDLTSPPADGTVAAHIDALLMLSMCAADTGARDDTERYCNLAAELSREYNFPLTQLRALHNLATDVYFIRGQFDLAQAADQEACRIARRHNLLEWLYFPLITLAWNYQITRQVVSARAALDELRQAAQPESGGFAYYQYISAQLEMDQGDFETAASLLASARTVAERSGDPGLNVEIRLGMCRCRRLAGDLARAWEWAEDALAYARRAGYSLKEADSLAEHGRLAWIKGDDQAALDDLERAAGIYTGQRAAYDLAYIALLQAAILDQQNHPGAGPAFRAFVDQVRSNHYDFLLDRERALVYPLIAGHLGGPDPAVSRAAADLLARLQDFPPLPLRIQALGGLQVWQGRRPVDRRQLRRRHAGELLALLLTSPGHSLAIDQAAETLAADKTPETARFLVNHASSTLRHALEPELPDQRFPSRYLEIAEGTLSLCLPEGSWLDDQAFEMAVRARDWEAALPCYTGEFLPEYRYADWAAARREILAHDYQRALLELAHHRLACADWLAALDLARRLIALDPWHEAAVVAAMRACREMNDLSGARRYYLALEKALGEELGVQPQESTRAFYRALNNLPPV